MQAYVIGQDTFSHDFEVKRSPSIVLAAHNFAKLFGSPIALPLCMIVLSAFGAWTVGLVAQDAPFMQTFYLQLFMLSLFLLGLIWVTRKRLQSNSLPEGFYRLEADDTQLCLTSAYLGMQRYGLGAIDHVRPIEQGTEVVLETGFVLPITGVELSLGQRDTSKALKPINSRNVWFTQDQT